MKNDVITSARQYF